MYKIKVIFLNFLLKIKNFKEKIQNSQNFSAKESQKVFKNSKVKAAINQAASIHINSVSDEEKKKVENISEKIIKKYLGDIPKTIKLIEKKGIRVYQTRFAVKLLSNINEKQGFLTPLKGFKAFYLNFWINLLCDKKLVFKFETPEMFIFTSKAIDNFYLASQVYRFVAFKKKLAGFEYEVQEEFKKIYKNPNVKNFNKLTAGDIFALKEAIARDVESIDFATKIFEETELMNKIGKKKQ